MNTLKLLISLIIIYSPPLQSQSYEWAFQAGGGSDDFGKAIVTDTIGNIYTVADYSGSINYGSINLAGAYFGSSLFAKHDTAGNVIWVQKIKGVHCTGISIDRAGNCYITGDCGKATFYGNNNSLSITSYGNGNGDVFIAKYDSTGNILWVKRFGDSLNTDWGNAIKTDKNGNSWVTGIRYHHDGTLGRALYNFFLLKYDSIGNLLWTQTTNWVGTANPKSIDVDSAGNCYVTGILRDSVIFGNMTLYAEPYGTSVFIVKYDVSGNIVWAKKEGAKGEGYGISLDGKGNFYLTGYFKSPSVFGNISLTNSTHSMFVAKYDTDGNNIWAKSSGAITGIGVASDVGSGGCFVSGWMKNTTTFGEGANTVSLVSAKANREIFVAKYNSNGDLSWAISPRGGAWEANQVMAIHADDKSNCYITGGYSGSTIFGNDSLNAPYATSGYFNIFLVKLKNNISITTEIAEQENIKSDITVYPNPTQGLFDINYPSIKNESGQLNIFDSTGKTIYTDLFNGSYAKKIDLSTRAKGIYFIVILAEGQRVVKKIVLE